MRSEKLNYKTNGEISKWFEALVDSVYNCILAIDSKGKVIFFNRGSEKLLGIKKDEVVGRFVTEVFPESQLLRILETGVKETGKSLNIKGKKIYSNRTPIVFNDEIVGAIAVFQDFTEVKKVKGQLESTKYNLKILDTILNEAYEAIVIIDENGLITKLNKKYEEFLGIKEEEVLGKHISNVIENTRMHIVVKTGEKEIGHTQKIKGNEMICSRIPIKKDGKIVGAVGKVLFKDVKELKALSQRLEGLENKLNHYKSEIKRMQEAKYSFDNIITQNERMKRLKKMALKASESRSTILIQGESGTGKELFAHAIHKASYRKYGAFIRVNCAAIPKDLLESELFGYSEGAFTGAKKEGKPGKFELADGGTIFLDEIGTMPLEMQAKLLRVLQENEIQRVGGTDTFKLDLRVIAATNENLEEEIARGNFREDLYYRLNVIRLRIPPLRKRLDDIPLLARSILNDLVKDLKMGNKKLAPQTVQYLTNYDWPGNVRELHNFIERGINLSPDNIVLPEHLPKILGKCSEEEEDNHQDSQDDWNLKKVVAQAEINAIKQALEYTNGNRTEAAKLLEIHRTSLYQKINRYGIDMSRF